MLKIALLSLTPIWTVVGVAAVASGILTANPVLVVVGLTGLIGTVSLVHDVVTAR